MVLFLLSVSPLSNYVKFLLKTCVVFVFVSTTVFLVHMQCSLRKLVPRLWPDSAENPHRVRWRDAFRFVVFLG